MKRILHLAPISFLAMMLLGACATIISGKHQEVAISTRPGNAAVYLDGFYEGDTPLIIDVERKGKHILTIDLPGYEKEEIVFDKELNAWTLGNIVMGAVVVGVVVDAITGAIWRIDSDEIEIDLLRDESTASLESGTLHLSVVLQSEPGWEKIGQLTPVH